jgi:rRNA-processing protein FCF1
MKKLIFGLFIFGLTIQAFAQVTKIEKLSEVVIVATNYKYLNEVDARDAAIPVEVLQRKVAAFDVKNSEFYEDEYESYFISFYIPEGKILAAYDKDGKIIRTVEKFKNIKLPIAVTKAVAKRFPGWIINEDVYKVNYHHEDGVTKQYKLRLKNGDKSIKVKTDDDGNFL